MRWLLLAAVSATAVATSGCGGGSHHAISPTTRASSSVTSTTSGVTTTTKASTTTTAPPSRAVVLDGNGVATVSFGQSRFSTLGGLDEVLGNPVKGPIDMSGNCDIDAAEQWSTLTAYFDQGVFVGYGTWAANGEPVPRGNFETEKGLRVGDTVTQAEQIYGSAFETSLAQGGSWSVSTPQGRLIGYLTGEPNQPGASPVIASIAAGSVGCPAATP